MREYPGKICIVCESIYTAHHHKSALCSKECIMEQARRVGMVAAQKARDKKKRGEYVYQSSKFEGSDRSGAKGWMRYMTNNECYFKSLYPRHDLAGAVADMRKRGAL